MTVHLQLQCSRVKREEKGGRRQTRTSDVLRVVLCCDAANHGWQSENTETRTRDDLPKKVVRFIVAQKAYLNAWECVGYHCKVLFIVRL